jgi:hypothetical protein
MNDLVIAPSIRALNGQETSMSDYEVENMTKILKQKVTIVLSYLTDECTALGLGDVSCSTTASI